THGLTKRHAFSSREALDLLKFVEGRLQALTVDLDPFAANQGETISRSEKFFDFCGGQRLAVEAHPDLKIEQCVQPKDGRRSRTNRRFNPRSAWTVHAPVRRHANHEAGLLHRIDIVEKTQRFLRRPPQGMKDLAGVNDRLQPGASLTGAAHRIQELQELGFVAYARKLAQGLAQRQMPQSAARRKARRIGRHEGEWTLRVGWRRGRPLRRPSWRPWSDRWMRRRPSHGQRKEQGR